MHRPMIILFLAFSSGLIQAAQKDLPAYIERCPLKLSNFKECVMRSAIKAIPSIVKGDPEYNIPSMQPFVIPFMRLIDLTPINVNLTNTKANGLETAKMVDFSFQMNDTDLVIKPTFQIPNVTLHGEYSQRGVVLFMALISNGTFTASLVNSKYKFQLNLKKVKLNEAEYYQASAETMDFEFEDMNYHVTTIYDDDTQFATNLNKALNKDWKRFIERIRPAISKILTKRLIKLVNNIAKEVPANKFFLSD